ncbi:MAG: N-6 DNA methylase [Cyanobacteria bacterium SIG26]|nr:N-6 DNA methylase [Cyanobacteria bacterium SIG26]
MARKKYEVSEEILQRGILTNPDKIGKYTYYNIGNTMIGALRDNNLIPNKDYKNEDRKPDGLIVDNTKRVIAVIENKNLAKYKTASLKASATKQALEVAQDLGAKFVISTDSVNSQWYSAFDNKPILNIDGSELKEVFGITTCNTPKTEKLIELLDNTINKKCRQITQIQEVDPTPLAYAIWQKIYKATTATPENCLYTFVEIFIFKYLSDLNILDELYQYNTLLGMYKKSKEDNVLSYYAKTIRPEIKKLFPEDDDKTTIINGTIFVNDTTGDCYTGYGKTFRTILEMFKDVELKNIDKDFKSKIFEVFFKKDTQKGGLGQYFTPLKVVQQIVNMADIKPNMRICDPACGVGKFLLDAISRDINRFYEIKDDEIINHITIEGFDKGFTKDSERTIILAKANMMIYFSDLIKNHPDMTQKFSKLFNKSFHLRTSVLGTLDYIPTEKQKYDLILSNPPYVGATDVYKKEIDGNAKLKKYYNKNGTGLESLFIEWIIRSLKDDGQAFIIVPEGFMYRLQDVDLRQFIIDECIINGIISLPKNTFFSTEKKTYIIALTKKKQSEKVRQISPIFTYLCSSTGETLDVNRFDTQENDLADAAYEYHSFKGNKSLYAERLGNGKIENKRLKVVNIDWFETNIKVDWIIENLWTEDEKIELGIKDEDNIMTSEELCIFIDNVIADLSSYKEAVNNV